MSVRSQSDSEAGYQYLKSVRAQRAGNSPYQRSRPAFNKAEQSQAKEVEALITRTVIGKASPPVAIHTTCDAPVRSGKPLRTIYLDAGMAIDHCRCAHCGGLHTWERCLTTL